MVGKGGGLSLATECIGSNVSVFERSDFCGKKKLFDFSIGMLVDMKIEERSPCDIPLLLKEDWLDYFNTSLNNASFFTCTMRTIQYIDKRINNFITEQNTVVIVLDVIHSE